MLTNSFGEEEGSVEKQLREAGEWIIHKTETTSQSNGKKILLFVFQWILPIWIFAIMLALGIVKLPFSTPILDDLLL
ncbi:hypothetical protein Leryth_025546 [Lithospermum erythrorhizon]|nr:hypothetical protein Leryth_025546 [Lithospermum erythrorhizon]